MPTEEMPNRREGELLRRLDDLELRLAAAQQDLQAADLRYRRLTEAMDEGLAAHELICDDRGQPCDYRYLELNPAFERLVGLTRAELLGKTRNEVLPDENPKWLRLFAEVARTGRPVHYTKPSVLGERVFEGTIYSPAPGQFAGVFTDISALKRAELEIRDLRDHLEARVKERTAELEQLIATLRKPKRPYRKRAAPGDSPS